MRSRKGILPWVIVAAVPLGLFAPMLLRGEVLFWGTPLLQFVPWRDLAFDLMLEGIPPFWNAYVGMGAPLLANYQLAILYPPNWLLFITGASWGHALLMMLHLIWGGWGMIALTRRLKLGLTSQMVSGLAFGLSGYLVARAWFISIDSSAAWLPWIILGLEILMDKIHENSNWKGVGKAVLILSILLGLQWLAGHAQMAWYSLVASGLWLLWRGTRQERRPDLLKVALLFLVSLFLAFLLASIQLLPTLEYVLLSQRAGGIDPEFAMTYSFWPWRITGLLMPDLFGNPAHGNYWGYGNYWEDAIYMGILPFSAVCLAIWLAIRKRTEYFRLSWFLVALSLFAFILALGKNTFVFPFLFEHIPTFDMFQAPTRWNLLLIFGLALLAGIGLEGWKTPTGRSLYWTRLGTAGVAVIGVAAYVGTVLVEGVEPTFVRAFAITGIGLCITGLLALFLHKDGSTQMLLVVGGFIAIDLFLAGRGLNPSTSADLYLGYSELRASISSDHRLYMPEELEHELKFDTFFRFDTFDSGVDWNLVRDTGLPNTSILDRIPTANNFDPLQPSYVVNWMDRLAATTTERQGDILELMNVGWIVVPDPNSMSGITLREIEGADRIHFIPEAMYVPDESEIVDLVMESDIQLSKILLLSEPAPESFRGSSRVDVLEKEVKTSGEQRMVVLVQDGSWLLVSDTWYPGWKAIVDGEEVQMYRADSIFRAIWLPSGEHSVEFIYQPSLFYAGALLSVLTWILALTLLVRWRSN